jgi:hypothetical protein
MTSQVAKYSLRCSESSIHDHRISNTKSCGMKMLVLREFAKADKKVTDCTSGPASLESANASAGFSKRQLGGGRNVEIEAASSVPANDGHASLIEIRPVGDRCPSPSNRPLTTNHHHYGQRYLSYLQPSCYFSKWAKTSHVHQLPPACITKRDCVMPFSAARSPPG